MGRITRCLMLAGLVLSAMSGGARAGGGLGAADVPAPHAAPATTAPVAIVVASNAASDAGCQPIEARNRNIPPRPRISAEALLAHVAP